jgi:kinetochore protein Mis12/MTW1
VNEVLYSCTDTFEQGLSSADPAVLGFLDRAAAENRTPEKDEDGNPILPEAKLEIEEGILKLETLMENAVDKNFDKLEIYTLRNILCLRRDEDVAEWIRLGHYEGLDTKSPSAESNVSLETLHGLRRKLQETQKLHAALLAEKNRNEAQIQRLRGLLQPSASLKHEVKGGIDGKAPFAFLTHTPAAQDLGVQTLPLPANGAKAADMGRTPLTTHTTFTTSQLPQLRQLLASLKPHLATKALPTRNEGEKEELARERKIYIESQSKRVLERRGINTSEGVDGAVEGQRVRSEEVRGLEGIVKGFGNRKEDEGEAMDTS